MTRALLLLCLTGCAHASRTAKAPMPGSPTLTVMTYNVNFGLAGEASTLETLVGADAEVVFLQETTPDWEATVRASTRSKWPYQSWHHSSGAGGLAVLSKRPLEVKAVVANPGHWFPALHVVVTTSLGKVQALVVHLRPPVDDAGSFVSGYFTTGPARKAEVDAFLAALEPGLPTLVVGDFNEGTSGAALQSLEARGFRSVLPEFHPNAKTWGWDVGALHLSAQLDHIVYGAGLEPLDARVVAGGRSDHQPVVASFTRAAAPALRPSPPRGGSLSISLR
jgi:endonuclease/exonuclease/phosphatase (EEP) superfamily protein YafD